MRLRTLILGLALALGPVAPGALAPAYAADPTLEELLETTDDITRGNSSVAVVEMQVKTARYERTMRMQIWARGADKTLIRILEPAKDAGVATLKVDENIWNYLPKVDRTMKVPAGMMSGNWMGSHFTNDDLVKESRLSEDFDAKMTARPGDGGEGLYIIELTPKPDAPVVWGSIVVRVRADRMPVSIQYKDEQGALVRTLSFGDYRDFGGRKAPATMTLTPEDKLGEFTKFSYISLDFNAQIPDSTFTLQALKP